MLAKTIDEVIDRLEDIIQTSKTEESTLGYFAALYQKVTLEVKDKLHTNYFDDDTRMETLDVIFANRYLLAYSDNKKGKEITKSWEVAFKSSGNNTFIVLQHLLFGMNAHINLDLGIAASEVSNAENINNLQSDFNKINEILAVLIDEVQKDLAKIWPALLFILKILKKADDFLINFGMAVARDGAWKFANEIVTEKEKSRKSLISARDKKIAEVANLITNPGVMVRFVFKIIRWGEKGSPADKISALEKLIKTEKNNDSNS